MVVGIGLGIFLPEEPGQALPLEFLVDGGEIHWGAVAREDGEASGGNNRRRSCAWPRRSGNGEVIPAVCAG